MQYRGILLLGIALLGSCNSETVSPMPQGVPISVRILPFSGTLFRLGSTDPFASPDEKPGWTRFAHDVWMDCTEMTQAEYRALVGGNPSRVVGDSLPVTNVSWYDAALAANARSKRDGFDTVYEYASVQPDAAGNATGLTALSVHLGRSGWRLPTEAEWEAAARAGSSTTWEWGNLTDSVQARSRAWYQKNSEGKPHQVATRTPNAWGLHDMAGNVMEWVNDWKGSFPKDTIDDFAGPESPSDVPDVPLKGGAYAYGISHLRPSSRTATYAAYRSARAEYVGFRLARGAFTPRYTSFSGQVVYTPPVTLVRTDVARIVGSWEARLVFINRADGKGTLTWIDYADANPVTRSLPDKDPVFHPVISPNGRWVAWSTVLEGSAQKGRIKARRLAKNDTAVLDLGEGAIPRWWVNGSDTFLVRANAVDNLASGWASTKTTAKRWSNGALVGVEQTWVANGSYHDGRSGQYLYTGYRRLRQHDMIGKISRVLFTGPGNGKGAGDTSQVCNASAAPDSSGRVMFLDFGYSGTSSVVGRSYGIHEVAFVSDNTGAIKRQIVSPIGEAQWEHMEWSNAPRWAVSGAIDGTGAYKNLYLVDVDAGSSTRIASGEQLWQPALWIGGQVPPITPGQADPDSSGAWNTPEVSVSQSEFAAKTQKFWPRRNLIEIAAIGSSRLKDGILPLEFHQGNAFNWGFDGSESIGDFAILRNYLLPHAPRLKVVIVSLMPGWLLNFRGDISWNSIPRTSGYRYDSSHSFWRNGIPSGYLEHVASRSMVAASKFDAAGSFSLEANGWGASTPEYTIYPPDHLDRLEFSANWNELVSIIDTCARRNIHLIMVNFPQSPAYRNTPSMGRWGPGWSTWSLLKARLSKLDSAKTSFHFYDANADGLHDYPDSAAWNSDHLSSIGARMLTRRLDSMIATF